jgi:hypothetical protein
MVGLLSHQLFHEPPTPSMIAPVRKPMAGRAKGFYKKQLGGR